MIVVTVFLSIMNLMEIHLDQNRKENCHHDHIPFNLKGNGNIVFSVYNKTDVNFCFPQLRLFHAVDLSLFTQEVGAIFSTNKISSLNKFSWEISVDCWSEIFHASFFVEALGIICCRDVRGISDDT